MPQAQAWLNDANSTWLWANPLLEHTCSHPVHSAMPSSWLFSVASTSACARR